MKLSAASRKHLDEIHGDLRAVILRSADISTQEFSVTDGVRTVAEQRALLDKKRTTTMNSRHLTGHAVDLAAIVGGKPEFNDRAPYRPIWNAVRTAAAELGVPIEWGGDWKTFVDVFHFQLPWADYPKGKDISFLDSEDIFDPQKYEKNAALVLDTEGGWNPADPSMFGVTMGALTRWDPSATLDDLKALTIDKAKQIYRALFWHPVRGDSLPPGLDYAVFDFGVHSGPSVAIIHLQQAVGTEADGIFGDLTKAAVRAANVPLAVNKIMDSRFARMKGLDNWATNRNGWTKRIDDVRATALAMTEIEPEQPPPEKPSLPKSLADYTIDQLSAELRNRNGVAGVSIQF